jgi:hypothetical protein
MALEVGGTAQNLHMRDTKRLLAICQRLTPIRVNFMGNTAAIVNYAEGIQDPRDDVSLELYRKGLVVLGGGDEPLDLARRFRDLIIGIRQIDLGKYSSSPASPQ